MHEGVRHQTVHHCKVGDRTQGNAADETLQMHRQKNRVIERKKWLLLSELSFFYLSLVHKEARICGTEVAHALR